MEIFLDYSGEITDQTPVFCQNSEHKWTIDQYIVVKVLADFIEDKKQYERYPYAWLDFHKLRLRSYN